MVLPEGHGETLFVVLGISCTATANDVFHLGFTKGVPIKEILRKFKEENDSGQDVEILPDDPGAEDSD